MLNRLSVPDEGVRAGMPPAAVIKVFIVDDHPMACDALAAYLETESDIKVVGSATRAREAVEQVRRLMPDVMLLDLELGDPVENGVTVAKAVTAMGLPTRLLVITSYNDAEHVLSAFRAGVHGYLFKTSGRNDIIQAVRVVASGQTIFDATATRIIQTQFASIPPRRGADPTADGGTAAASPLTEREWEVLELAAQNLPNKMIALRLHITVKTTKCHISRVLHKLNVEDRKEAAAWYRDHTQERPPSATTPRSDLPRRPSLRPSTEG
jgi:DNA-binding NarL/FixJ family response regulator